MRCSLFAGALVCAVVGSCGLIGGGDDEIVAQDSKDFYYLEVSSNRSFYNLGDEFNKFQDFKVFKGRIDGSLRIRIPNEECIVSIDGNVVDPGIPFNFWGDTRVDVEHDGLTDWYIAVVNTSGGGGGGGGGGGQGGDVGWVWADDQTPPP
jgi:hypothetical protein